MAVNAQTEKYVHLPGIYQLVTQITWILSPASVGSKTSQKYQVGKWI
jgi:hypothetical protein